MLQYGYRLLYGVKRPKELDTTMAGFKHIERYVVMMNDDNRRRMATKSRSIQTLYSSKAKVGIDDRSAPLSRSRGSVTV